MGDHRHFVQCDGHVRTYRHGGPSTTLLPHHQATLKLQIRFDQKVTLWSVICLGLLNPCFRLGPLDNLSNDHVLWLLRLNIHPLRPEPSHKLVCRRVPGGSGSSRRSTSLRSWSFAFFLAQPWSSKRCVILRWAGSVSITFSPSSTLPTMALSG